MQRIHWQATLLAFTAARLLAAAQTVTFTEDFSTDPAGRGWRIHGNTNLFRWNPANGNLEVTWDSRETNSYFFRSLGTVLSTNDDFSLSFDLRLNDFTPNINPAKTNSPFQIAVGLIRTAQATQPGFIRGSGFDSPNLVEFDFFPDPGGAWPFGPSLTSVMIDSTGLHYGAGGFAPETLTTNDVFRVQMVFDATNRMLTTVILRNGLPFSSPGPVTLGTDFTDFRVDAFAVNSYSDIGQFPGYEGSILAHGTMDNVSLITPPPAISELAGGFSNGVWRVTFQGRLGFDYTLQRSTNLTDWTGAAGPSAGTTGSQAMQDATPPANGASYRVQADKP